MSNQPDQTPEGLSTDAGAGGDWGEVDYDEQQRADAEVNLEEPSATDDESWSPPDRRPRGAIHQEADLEGEEETIDERVTQEEPEEGTAYGAHETAEELDARDTDMAGGDDPDAIPAQTDVLGEVTDPDGLDDATGQVGEVGDDEVVVDEAGPEAWAMRVVEDPED